MDAAPSPAEALPAELRAAFETLRTRFRAGLAERWREIEAARSPGERVAALHRLAGAAGGYGFGELSLAAATAERLAERLADGGDSLALEEALATLRRLVQETAGP